MSHAGYSRSFKTCDVTTEATSFGIHISHINTRRGTRNFIDTAAACRVSAAHVRVYVRNSVFCLQVTEIKMDEDPLKSASSTSCCTTALSTRETVSALDEETQIIVESTAESSESSCPEENSSPRFDNLF